MPVRSADLFCGAGGITTGLSLALEQLLDDVAENVEHVAINHWDQAIETHRRNHPWARHVNKDIELVRRRDVFPEGTLDILAAAPECKHYSSAAGGKPKKDQKRMQPWLILPWIQELRPTNVLIENVPEFRSWGPLDDDGHPVKDRRGDTFDAFINAIKSLGYAVDYATLNAADYGDPTTRKRLFIVARRHARPVFPQPTHAENPGEADPMEPWRPAADVIDWSAPGQSIWTRGLRDNGKKPLVDNTMRRIAEGIRRYAHPVLEPFADAVADLDQAKVRQLQTTAVRAEDVTKELVAAASQPFLVQVTHGGRLLDHEDPMPTVTAANRGEFALVSPYLIPQHSGAVPREVADPVSTIAAGGAISKIEPEAFILPQNGGPNPKGIDDPLPTVLGRGMIQKIETDPFILPRNGRHRGIHSNPPYDPDEEPLHTVTASNHDGHLVSPYLVPFYGEREDQAPRTHDPNEPLPTVPASKTPAGVARPQPFLVQYNGNSDAKPTTEPLPTQTGKDRFALVVPELWPCGLDVRFRMLQPRELARAMGFPDSYEFCVNLARELCLTLLTDETRPIVEPQPAPGADELEFPPQEVVSR